MQWESELQALIRMDEGERCQVRALHLPWPRALSASDLLAGLIKPPLQHPRRWGPGRMAEQGGECERPPHGEAWHGIDAPPRKGVRGPVESERMRGACTSWARRGTIRQDTERTRPNEGHSRQGTAENRTHRDTGRMRPCDVCRQAGTRRGRDLLGKGEGGTE